MKTVTFNEDKNITIIFSQPSSQESAPEPMALDFDDNNDEEAENLRSAALKKALSDSNNIKQLLDTVVTHAFALYEQHQYNYSSKKRVSSYSADILLQHPKLMLDIIRSPYKKFAENPFPIAYRTRAALQNKNDDKLEVILSTKEHRKLLISLVNILSDNPKLFKNYPSLKDSLDDLFSEPDALDILLITTQQHPALLCLLSDNILDKLLNFYVAQTESIEQLHALIIERTYIIDKLYPINFINLVNNLRDLSAAANNSLPIDQEKLQAIPAIAGIRDHCWWLYEVKLNENPFVPIDQAMQARI